MFGVVWDNPVQLKTEGRGIEAEHLTKTLQNWNQTPR